MALNVKLKRQLSKLLEEVLCQSITLSMLFCISKIALTVENRTCRDFFEIDSAKYRAFFQTQRNVVYKAAIVRV